MANFQAADRPAEKSSGDGSYVRSLVADVRDHLHGLLAANLVLVGCALPGIVFFLLGFGPRALTFAMIMCFPAWVALLGYSASIARSDIDRPFISWRGSFARYWRRACALAVVEGIGGMLLWWGLAFKIHTAAPIQIAYWAGIVLIFGLLTQTVVIASTLVALYDASPLDAFRNGLLLLLSHPVPMLALALTGAFLAWLTALLSFGPLIVTPALFATCLTHTVRDLVSKHRGLPA